MHAINLIWKKRKNTRKKRRRIRRKLDRVIRKLERDIKIHKKLLAQLANKSKESKAIETSKTITNTHRKQKENVYDLNDTILFEVRVEKK
jgi:hypothetical protein